MKANKANKANKASKGVRLADLEKWAGRVDKALTTGNLGKLLQVLEKLEVRVGVNERTIGDVDAAIVRMDNMLEMLEPWVKSTEGYLGRVEDRLQELERRPVKGVRRPIVGDEESRTAERRARRKQYQKEYRLRRIAREKALAHKKAMDAAMLTGITGEPQ